MTEMWLLPQDDPRTQLPFSTGEKGSLTSSLEHHRLTLRLKCEDLTPEQMGTRSVPPSDLSLLGMVQHMARVEHRWFRLTLGGDAGGQRLYDDGTGGFTDITPTEEGVNAAWLVWRTEVDHARRVWDDWPEAELIVGLPDGRGGTVSVRDMAVHMVEEYARHMGHVDLLRECLDGRTGR